MLSKKLVKEVLSTALNGGGDFAEVFCENKKSNGINLENSNIEKVTTGYNRGVGVRVLTGDQISYAYTDELSRESLLKTAKVAGAASGGSKLIEVNDLTTSEVRSAHPIKVSPQTIEKSEKAELVTRADKAAREHCQHISQVQVSYMDYYQQVLIANSNGLWVEDERTRTNLSVNAIAAKEGTIQTGSEREGYHQGFEVFKKRPPEEIGREAARQAVTMLKADPAPSGKMPVVINHGFGGVLFHEACGHGLEAEAVQKGSSVFAGKMGEQVASDKVTAADDATIENEWGSFNIDDEGAKAQRTVLIEDGYLRDYMYDYRTKVKEGRDISTGNGRRESYRSVPFPRMTNTFIAPGKKEPEEIIKAVDDGFYAKKLSGGQVDPATGEFVFTVSEGYLIKGGKVADPVRGATLVGRGIDVLNKISMVGNDLELAPGMCGKEGQSVAAGVGQPTLLVDQITVGGTERKGE